MTRIFVTDSLFVWPFHEHPWRYYEKSEFMSGWGDGTWRMDVKGGRRVEGEVEGRGARRKMQVGRSGISDP
jgi:hypothetical protein